MIFSTSGALTAATAAPLYHFRTKLKIEIVRSVTCAGSVRAPREEEKAKQGAQKLRFSLARRILPDGMRCVTRRKYRGECVDDRNNNDKTRTWGRKEKKNKNRAEKRLVIACRRNWAGPLIRAVYKRTFYRTEERVRECVRLTVGHAGIIKRPFELVPALILLNVRSDHR